MSSDTVTRYVPTYVGRDGLRTLIRSAQGRDTFATEEEATEWLAGFVKNNTPDRIKDVFGLQAVGSLQVRECRCWAGHFDPVGIYFDDLPLPRTPVRGVPHTIVPDEDGTAWRCADCSETGCQKVFVERYLTPGEEADLATVKPEPLAPGLVEKIVDQVRLQPDRLRELVSAARLVAYPDGHISPADAARFKQAVDAFDDIQV